MVSPCKGIEAPAAETSRDRVLEEEEIRLAWRVFDAIGWPFGSIGKLLLLTGARRSEIAEARWQEIDLAAKTLTLPGSRTKNGEPSQIPLSDAAAEIISALPRIEGKAALLFSTTGATPVSGFSRSREVIERAMVAKLREAATERGQDPEKVEAPKPWTLHDLRRTCASGMASLKIAPHVIEAVLNHKNGTIKGVAKVYNRYSYAAEKRAALDAWARRLNAIVTGTEASNVVELARAAR